jgi:hypothetical protein
VKTAAKLCATCAFSRVRFNCLRLDCLEHGYAVYPTETCSKHEAKAETVEGPKSDNAMWLAS